VQVSRAERPVGQGPDHEAEPEADEYAMAVLAADAKSEQLQPFESEAAIATVLDQLDSAGLLSNERFVQSRLHARQARFGNRRIEHELKQHGVSPSADQLAELRASEVERAVHVLKTRFSWPQQPGPAGVAQQQKAQRLLAGRGFSSEAIRLALRTASRASDLQNA
jgi:regulatory protein